jgi:hypothetical protein
VDPTAWDRLTSQARLLGTGLPAPGPSPWPGSPPGGRCPTCLGPAPAGALRCYPCGLHWQCAPGALASAVLPVAYAVKGGPHARRLWVYKSGRPDAPAARRALAVLLLVVLREHGPCLWRAAGWDTAGPTHVAVVPSSRGRPGPHPLRALAQPYLRLPWASLTAVPGADGGARELDPGRFTARPLRGARVLLLDDTWTTGASVQSAAMALRRAGAAGVAAVVLGRHLPRPGGPGQSGPVPGGPVPGGGPAPPGVAFSPGQCALHRPAA